MTEPSRSPNEIIWACFRALLKKRWLIIGITGFFGIASVVISLLMSNWYMAETRLLIPGQTSSGLLSGVISGRLGSSASSLLGGLVSDYQHQLAILDSRTVKESVVEEFSLIEVYDLTESDAPMKYAIDELNGNVEFVVDNEYNYLSVRAYDKDPQRAADMANFFVSELNRIGVELSTQTAREYRRTVEKRYQSFVDSLSAVTLAIRLLQEETGVLDLPTQGAAFAEALAEWRTQIFVSQFEVDNLRALYGDSHSQTRAAQRAVDQAWQSYNQAWEGQERVMPVAQDILPEVAHRFLELQTDARIFGTLLEFTRPVLEEARLEEERASESVQTLDHAIPSVEKARPWRAAICVISTFSGFLLSILYVLISSWWKNSQTLIAERLSSG